MIDNTWKKLKFNTVFNGGNPHFFLVGSGLTSFDISSVKIEFGADEVWRVHRFN